MAIVSTFCKKGGVGKTTFIGYLAHYYADQGKKVLILSADDQNSIFKIFGADDKIFEENDNYVEVLIAGQFGAHLPAESLVGIGILPKCVENKLIYVGNSSKTGAYKTLMSSKAKQEMESLAREIEYMELAESDNYEQLFIKSMTFGEV